NDGSGGRALRGHDGPGRRVADRLAPAAARGRGGGHGMNDLAFVERAVRFLESQAIDTWIFGGWGEELRGLIHPREHVDLDLLYPGESWEWVDELELEWDASKRFPWKRAFFFEATRVELFLVQRDAEGWYTQLKERRHKWPDN